MIEQPKAENIEITDQDLTAEAPAEPGLETSGSSSSSPTTNPTSSLDEDEPSVKSFEGRLDVKFPETNETWVFSPVETIRGRKGGRWSYPSPIPAIREACPTSPERVAQWTKLLGESNLDDLIEGAMNRHCQEKWKQAVDSSKDKAAEAINRLFAEIFYAGKQREAVSPAGLRRKAQACREEAMEEKKKNGLSDRFKQLVTEAKKYLEDAEKLDMEELAALEAEILAEPSAKV